MATDLDELTLVYLENKDTKLIPYIYAKASSNVRIWMHSQGKIQLSEFPEDFEKDTAMEFITRVYEERMTNVPHRVLLSICRSFSRKFVYTSMSGELKSQETLSFSIEDRLLLEEFVFEELLDLSEEMKGVLLYLWVYPGELSRIKELHKDEPVFYITMIKLWRIKREISYDGAGLMGYSPKTQTSKALFLSSLYSVSPALLVLFFLLGDARFFQFCLLFEDQKITMPSLSLLTGLTDNVSKLMGAVNGDSNDLDMFDIELLNLLCVECDREVGVNDLGRVTTVLSIYLKKSIGRLVDNHNKLQEKIVEGVDICNSKEIERVYKMLRSEFNSQLSVFYTALKAR